MILSLLIIFPRCIKQRTETVGFLTRGIKNLSDKMRIISRLFPIIPSTQAVHFMTAVLEML